MVNKSKKKNFFESAPKLILNFWGTNNIFVNCIDLSKDILK